ncbi:hypothetical protein [Glycomyces xiaoerkulensis]|uniref:hypothetical protein n=1 Tax=Glycomyces xiaoerkulensis TaxID=2038139 RepID=UPI000C258ABC|nr:hypothetical protein [Glycomyces xiaoerkulensis]
MTDDSHDPERVLRGLEGTPLGERLSTPRQRQEELYDLMAAHEDPLWREMGEQLKSGAMTLSDALATPAYRDHLTESLELAKERQTELYEAVERSGGDPDVLAAELEPESETQEEEAAETGRRTCPECGRLMPGSECRHCF